MPPPYSINNSDYSKEQIFNADQKVSDTDNSDQLEYIRNDVEKQDGVANSIKSIKLGSISSSANHSAALVKKTDDSTLLYMWGDNNSGQLGFTANGYANHTPVKVNPTYFTSNIIQIALSSDFSAALLEDGSLYMWGNNRFGQLGNTTYNLTETPNPIPAKVNMDTSSSITQITLGEDHSAALLEDGSLYMWGRNRAGQLGNPTNNGNSNPNPIPRKVIGLVDKKIAQISLGREHSAALLEDGSLYMWGYNGNGQLGNGTTADTNTPILVSGLSSRRVKQIAVGSQHSAALLDDGSLYMWGANYYGQLGNKENFVTNNANPNPTFVTDLSGKKITKIALGYEHSAALLDDGSLYTWGCAIYGRLGNGTAGTGIYRPTPVTALDGQKIIQIVLGYEHSAALLDDGSIYIWGQNLYGQLGNGRTGNVSTPTWMSYLGKDSHITANDKITAKEAVEKFWVNNSFNLNGFKSSFNLINIPTNNQQEITMDINTPPTYDNDARTVSMNVSIKYYYNEDGFLAAHTAVETITIRDFKIPPTDMVINPNYPHTRVDLFAFNVLNYKGSDLYNYLTKDYVIATSVVADKLTAKIINQDNQTGKIQIALTIPSYFDEDSNFVVGSKTFTLDYDFTPKYQQTIIRTLDISVYPKDITPTQFKQRIIDEGAVVNGNNLTLTPSNITFLKKFLSFESVPAGTTYTLTWNADQTDDETGVISFNLSLNQYYSVDGDLVTNALPINNLTLDLLGSGEPSIYPETKITTKLNAPAITSSQSFLDIVYANSEVDNDKLSLYVDGLQTIPSSGDITNIDIQTETDVVATFNLDISAHYDASGILQGHKSFNFNLRISPKYSETNITALPEGSYPTDFTPTQFKQQLINDGADVQGSIYALNAKNISLLYRFLDLTTVPSNTKYILTWSDDKINDTTGQIGFNLIIDQYYNADGDLVNNAAKPFNDLVLQLANVDTPTIKAATSLKTKVGSPTVASKDAFLQIIYTTDNHLIYSQLDIFLDGLLTIPTAAAVTVSYITENKGIAVFRVILSGYYDGASENMINAEKSYNFEVNVKYVPISYDQFPIWWFIIVGLGAWALLIVFIGFTAIRYQQWAAKNRKVKVKKAKPEKPEKKIKWFKTTKDDGIEKEQKDSVKKTKKIKKVKPEKIKKRNQWFKPDKANTEQIKPKASNNISEKAETSKTNVKQVEPEVLDSATKQAKKTKPQTKPTQPKSSDQASKKVKTTKSRNDEPKQNDPKKTIKTDTKQKTDKSKTLNSKPKVDNATDLSRKKTNTRTK